MFVFQKSFLFLASQRRHLSAKGLWIIPVLFFCLPMTGLAEEQITDFSSEVIILESGKIAVIENITVKAEGNRIKRGIYRDFPTRYHAKGRVYKVSFAVNGVERDGSKEAYHIKKITNGVRVYMGRKDVLIPSGLHTYTLHYVTDRQLGFFPDHDELYWNVTGNGWDFPIKHADVTVTLPASGMMDDYKVFTGPTGSRKHNARLVRQDDVSLTLETTRPLAAHSGLTVVVAWPKGIVKEPGFIQQWAWLVRDFFSSTAVFLGLLALVVYYGISWHRVGRDPAAGTIIPRFEPPEKIAPAAGRFIMQMGFDQKSFAATLVNMAVKGVVKIILFEKTYTIRLLQPDSERLSPGELAVRKALFGASDSVVLNKENHSVIRAAMNDLKKTLRQDMVNVYFRENRAKLIPGLLISLCTIALIVLDSNDVGAAAMISLWLIIWSGGSITLLLRMIDSWRHLFSAGRSAGALKRSFFNTMTLIPFLGGWFMGIYMLTQAVSPMSVALILTVLAINIYFAWLLKAPTPAGRNIMDQLEGLRLYLSVAEKDRLNMLNPPEKTPALFERLFPWALALDVEQQWCDQFASQFDQLTDNAQQYHPGWYTSSHGFSSRHFSASLGENLASTIAVSSVAPGSSSGFGSGGSSGGGGGGGGGGGW